MNAGTEAIETLRKWRNHEYTYPAGMGLEMDIVSAILYLSDTLGAAAKEVFPNG